MSLTGWIPCAPWQLAHWATCGVALRELLAVPARPVLRELVHAERRIELLHQRRRRRGTLPQSSGICGGDGLPDEALLLVVRDLLVLAPRIAAMAEGAGESGLRVDVVGEEPSREA